MEIDYFGGLVVTNSSELEGLIYGNKGLFSSSSHHYFVLKKSSSNVS